MSRDDLEKRLWDPIWMYIRANLGALYAKNENRRGVAGRVRQRHDAGGGAGSSGSQGQRRDPPVVVVNQPKAPVWMLGQVSKWLVTWIKTCLEAKAMGQIFYLARSPSSALSHLFFGWEASPTKIGYNKKGSLILTSLLEDLAKAASLLCR